MSPAPDQFAVSLTCFGTAALVFCPNIQWLDCS